ncbi:MAG: hypothetical protein O9256_01560, partial [Rhizobiaceae bacterium]|nr:hypothetical protein [Rhizobiaceae bacterium]
RLKSRNSTFSDGPGAHLTSRGKRKRNLHRFLHSNRLRNYTSFADAIWLRYSRECYGLKGFAI